MGPILRSLVSLQAIELELRKTQQRFKQAQQVVIRQEQKIRQLLEALAAKKDEVKLTRMQCDKLELELKIREDDIAKYRLALNTARTNKDYSAILTRINTQKADKSKLEDQILSFLSQIDADQAFYREIESNIEQEKARFSEIRQESETKQKVTQTELDRLTHLHQEAHTQVPSKERDLFERLAERYSGEVLAEVTEMNHRRKEHSCGGCYMSITLESVNALMTRDEVVICPNCGRILVLDKNPKQEQPAV